MRSVGFIRFAKIANLVMAVCLFAFGITLIASPNMDISVVRIAAGVTMALFGIRHNPKEELIMDEKKQIERIRAQYNEHTETDLEKLKSPDKKAKLPANIFAYAFGIVGALVLGTGMRLAMEVIGSGAMKTVGIVIGIAGIAMAAVNYFLWKKLAERGKRKYASQILEQSDKLLHC